MSAILTRTNPDLRAVFGIEPLVARLNYLEPIETKPFMYAYATPPNAPPRFTPVDERAVFIRNGRPNAADFSLDREGFALAQDDGSVPDFYDQAQVRAVYYRHVARLVKQYTGAVKVHVFDHNVRSAIKESRGEAGAKLPAKRVHNDYTAKSAPQRVRDLFPREADALLKRRFAFVNVWRPIVGPVQESPLAVADAQSISAGDWVPTDLIYKDRIGETYSLVYNDAHRWFYFPQMQPSEALLIKCYDSSRDGRARFAAHSAFDDPTSPPDAPPRESIEARTVAFFD
jgi:hypothetical protein